MEIIIKRPGLKDKKGISTPGVKPNNVNDRKKMMNANESGTNEKIEFKPGRKPKDAIEGDMIRFMYNDYDNDLVSWLQGRLVSRIDKLEDAVDSEWMKNRFRVDTISTIAHWSNLETQPASTTST